MNDLKKDVPDGATEYYATIDWEPEEYGGKKPWVADIDAGEFFGDMRGFSTRKKAQEWITSQKKLLKAKAERKGVKLILER